MYEISPLTGEDLPSIEPTSLPISRVTNLAGWVAIYEILGL